MVLYLLADAARVRGGLGALEWSVGTVALLATLMPALVRRVLDVGLPGVRRLSLLGVLAGVALAAEAARVGESGLEDAFIAITVPFAASMVLDLAATVPDRPRPFVGLRPATYALATVTSVLGILAVFPEVRIGGRLLVASGSGLSRAPWGFTVGALGLALVLRLARDRMGSTTVALASNAWGLLGLVPSFLLAALLVALVSAGLLRSTSPWTLMGGAVAVAVGLYGHLALVDPGRRLEAAAATRSAVSWTVTVCVVGGLAAAMSAILPRDPFTMATASAAVLAVATIVRRLAAPVVRRLLAPFGGRLLDAVAIALERMERTSTLEEIGAAVLPPLRAASGSTEAEPILLTSDPRLSVRIDAAGTAHVRDEAMPDALIERLNAQPGEPIVFADLDAVVVRRPDVRPLHEVLERWGALSVVPLVLEGQLEAVIVVPRGKRAMAPRLEEMAALGRLADRLAPRLALVTGLVRAQARVGRLSHAKDRAEERADSLEAEVTRLRADAEVLRQGRGLGTSDEPVVAYAPSSRAFEQRLSEVAPTEATIGLVAEPGLFADRVARRVHAASARSGGPFVVADCAATQPDDAERALIGAEGETFHPGWLRLAHGGTLFLSDVAALPPKVQRALAESLATRSVRPLGSSGAHPVDVRIVSSSRVPYAALVERGSLDPELARWLTQVELEVPALRDRREDIPSLTLLAIARACRIQGREPVGIAQQAMDRLVAHDFPGNLRELSILVQRALEATDGATIDAAAVRIGGPEAEPPPTAPTPVSADDLEGSLVDIEKKALERALARANGNKSEAARSLGLKRTTFLDKLRRHGLEDAARGDTDAP